LRFLVRLLAVYLVRCPWPTAVDRSSLGLPQPRCLIAAEPGERWR
jgi:hypothetical protein